MIYNILYLFLFSSFSFSKQLQDTFQTLDAKYKHFENVKNKLHDSFVDWLTWVVFISKVFFFFFNKYIFQGFSCWTLWALVLAGNIETPVLQRRKGSNIFTGEYSIWKVLLSDRNFDTFLNLLLVPSVRSQGVYWVRFPKRSFMVDNIDHSHSGTTSHQDFILIFSLLLSFILAWNCTPVDLHYTSSTIVPRTHKFNFFLFHYFYPAVFSTIVMNW